MNFGSQKRCVIWTGVCVGLLGGSVSASAEVWSTPTRIVAVYPTSNEYLFVTEYKNTAYSTCDGGGRWAISRNYPNYAAMVASLLAAFAADKQIAMAIDELPPACQGTVNRFTVSQ